MKIWISIYGWKMKRAQGDRVKRLIVVCMLLPALLPIAMAAEEPSLELLEFLGDWETADGEWQDPLEFMQDVEALEAENAKLEDDQDAQ
jgi:hypothetical protein